MKTKDFERLKAICEKEGFMIESYCGGKTAIVGVKDPWEGVEFVEYENIHLSGGQRYFKINWIDSEEGLIHVDSGYLSTSKCKPSNEQAYVEQLKKEAFERFGEIKVGQKFKDWDGTVFEIDDIGFSYSKRNDQLRFGGWIIYQQGKWAERVKERVSVSCIDIGYYFNNKYSTITFDVTGSKVNNEQALEMASQLEKYLNNEIE